VAAKFPKSEIWTAVIRSQKLWAGRRSDVNSSCEISDVQGLIVAFRFRLIGCPCLLGPFLPHLSLVNAARPQGTETFPSSWGALETRGWRSHIGKNLAFLQNPLVHYTVLLRKPCLLATGCHGHFPKMCSAPSILDPRAGSLL